MRAVPCENAADVLRPRQDLGRRPRRRRRGGAGADLVMAAPPGTAVHDDATGELIADLVAREQRAMVARGGRGGGGEGPLPTPPPPTPPPPQQGGAGRGG